MLIHVNTALLFDILHGPGMDSGSANPAGSVDTRRSYCG